MTTYDVFNGDADGLCALHQLRLAQPADATLVTGVKREIDLLRRVDAVGGDAITVLDVSLDKNRDALARALAAGASVRYVDHHYAGEIPEHAALDAHIDTDAETCTGLIVDRLLEGRFRAWAVVAAFGDNLLATARAAAAPLGLDAGRIATLETLGTLLNYNGYGATVEDLHFAPDELYRKIVPWKDPQDFVREDEAFATLGNGYREDVAKARAIEPERAGPGSAMFVLPDAAWARRVGGVYANELAQAHPARAHALLTERADGAFVVSVRAPVENRSGADELCREFDTGGGRQAAAGINRLPADELERFADELAKRYADA